jgi:hypothetical protein
MFTNCAKVLNQQLICYELNYNKKSQTTSTKVTNDYNKITHIFKKVVKQQLICYILNYNKITKYYL